MKGFKTIRIQFRSIFRIKCLNLVLFFLEHSNTLCSQVWLTKTGGVLSYNGENKTDLVTLSDSLRTVQKVGPTPPVCLAAELAQVQAAHLAAALGASFAAQVAAQRAVAHQGLQEYLVQRQVVCAEPGRSGLGDIHLGVTLGAEHGERQRVSVLLRRLR